MEPKEIKLAHSIDRLTLGFMITFAIISIIAGVTAFIVMRDMVKSWTITHLPGVPVFDPTATSDPNANITDPVIEETPVVQLPVAGQAPVGPTPQPWDGGSRVTILIMGLDFRDWEAGMIPRTDTMILLTIDPLIGTAGILSIPRDLWVNIPGYDYGKINTAYRLGERYKDPGGGPALAVETVEHFLGVPIQYYAQIDFTAFIIFIDHLGGIKLTIKEPITIYPINFPEMVGSKKVTLEPGRYRVSGAYALAYARNRKTAGGDFDRAHAPLTR